MSNERIEKVENVETQILPIIDNINNQTIILNNDRYEFEITHADEIKSKLIELSNAADNYVYNEDDRQVVKKFRASINKFSKQFTKTVNEHRDTLFGKVNDDKKEIVTLLDDIKDKIERGIIAEDERYKDEKLSKFKDAFVEAKASYDFISKTDFKYEDISKSSWLNRSVSESNALAEMNERIQTIDAILKGLYDDNRKPENDLIINKLNKHKWNSLNALNDLLQYFKDEDARIEQAIKEKEEREAAEAQSEKNKEVDELVEQESDKTIALIISAKDLPKVKAALRRVNVSYELG